MFTQRDCILSIERLCCVCSETVLRETTYICRDTILTETVVFVERLQEMEDKSLSTETYMSSREWLDKFGLKAKKLGFYDVLAGVAFRHQDGVVNMKVAPVDPSQQTDAVIIILYYIILYYIILYYIILYYIILYYIILYYIMWINYVFGYSYC